MLAPIFAFPYLSSLRRIRHLIHHLIFVSVLLPFPVLAMCKAPLALQVLGSGGPIADDARASSGYLLWVNGKSRLLIDAGGGTALRFGEANGKFEDLEAVLLTHLHADHSAELPALLKSSYFSKRKTPLPILGPSGNKGWPSTEEFIHGLFNSQTGIYRYLDGFMDGSDGMFKLEPKSADATSREIHKLHTSEDITIYGVGVQHGPVPAIGYVIEINGKRIAFSGDQNNHNPAFTQLIKDADLLVMTQAIPENAGEIAQKLHATPSHIGKMAQEGKVQQLLLSHFMQRSLRVLDENKKLIQTHYKGKLAIAEDLACYDLL
ncbi:MBL fold metallo-hydrolase [Alteromonas sp. a30]|uniref:MBL fold metallo-hydrolase n=1 Tax=Alteromonas sp. a30 TaxID=2730917 RepID=UPI002280066F|nr:MBL fold metallo-hydrolase [Alteromonas sp. a30]MCY7294835.1 MBL fold metallo-hydrolase [Alteromonas sp. a30]